MIGCPRGARIPSNSSEFHVVLDTSVLINFLALDRTEALLSLCKGAGSSLVVMIIDPRS